MPGIQGVPTEMDKPTVTGQNICPHHYPPLINKREVQHPVSPNIPPCSTGSREHVDVCPQDTVLLLFLSYLLLFFLRHPPVYHQEGPPHLSLVLVKVGKVFPARVLASAALCSIQWMDGSIWAVWKRRTSSRKPCV